MPLLTKRFAGLYLELRAVPVLLWSFSGVALGTGLGWENGDRSVGWFAVAAVIGALIQGFVAHTVNDITDWRSGTDRDDAPRVLSGGSKVLGAGLLSERELTIVGWVAAVIAIGGGFVVAAERGWWLLSLGVVGIVGATTYTLWPVRAAYRPFLGEGVAFVCVGSCVVGGYGVQTGSFAVGALVVGIAHGAVCVAMLMLHHYLDREPDRRAVPVKVTSVVFLESRARGYATGWAVAAAGIFALAVFAIDTALIWAALAAALSIAVHATVSVDEPTSVTRAELGVIGLGVAGAVASTVALAPPLAWIIAIPPIAIAIDVVAGRRFLRRASDNPPPANIAPTLD